MVDKSNEDLRYLAESVVTIMRLLHEETESHRTDQKPKYRDFCGAFERDLTRLAKDLESIRKQQYTSRFKKYFNAHNMRDESSHLTRQVDDLRANATLIAAIGTRVTVETGVAAVEDRVAHLEHQTVGPDVLLVSKTAQCELGRFEKDFYALKIADIHLEFDSARAGPFTGDPQRHDERAVRWTDYRGTVRGAVQTVRVFHGSDRNAVRFSSFTAAPFGFCDSPRLTSLVFHGEFCTLDEYANRLPSPRPIVDWELSLISDIAELHGAGFTWSAIFALVNTYGTIIIAHIGELDNGSMVATLPPFHHWFMRREVFMHSADPLVLSPSGYLGNFLHSLIPLHRDETYPVFLVRWRSIHEALTSRGCVYHPLTGQRIAELASRDVEPDEWHVLPVDISREDWKPKCIPTVVETMDQFTHFIVPLRRKMSKDGSGDCGYFLKTAIWFGASLPDITCSWLAQAKSILSKSLFPQGDPSEYVIPHFPCLQLSWEMITVAKHGASRAVDLPDCILHVFVQVPLLAGGRIDEPRVYWYTQPNATQPGDIPAAALEIRMSWDINFTLLRWETHHYEVADRMQEECGLDPTTNAAAQSLGLPLLSVVTDQKLQT
ncbi:hypothetical protein DFH06DRAFT_147506 [Mycena polygramma]|nr:hypothetical protein DFH06DRAFT_147506 [Mycena polygramma]